MRTFTAYIAPSLVFLGFAFYQFAINAQQILTRKLMINKWFGLLAVVCLIAYTCLEIAYLDYQISPFASYITPNPQYPNNEYVVYEQNSYRYLNTIQLARNILQAFGELALYVFAVLSVTEYYQTKTLPAIAAAASAVISYIILLAAIGLQSQLFSNILQSQFFSGISFFTPQENTSQKVYATHQAFETLFFSIVAVIFIINLSKRNGNYLHIGSLAVVIILGLLLSVCFAFTAIQGQNQLSNQPFNSFGSFGSFNTFNFLGYSVQDTYFTKTTYYIQPYVWALFLGVLIQISAEKNEKNLETGTKIDFEQSANGFHQVDPNTFSVSMQENQGYSNAYHLPSGSNDSKGYSLPK